LFPERIKIMSLKPVSEWTSKEKQDYLDTIHTRMVKAIKMPKYVIQETIPYKTMFINSVVDGGCALRVRRVPLWKFCCHRLKMAWWGLRGINCL